MEQPLKEYHLDVSVKKIQLREQKQEIAEKIKKEFNLSTITANILAARGIVDFKDIEIFLTPTLQKGINNPIYIKGGKEFFELISNAQKNKLKVAISCDFDVDGLTAGAQLFEFLQMIGVETVVFVPDRFKDGYGLSENIVNNAVANNCSIIICLDFGTNNEKELKLAKKYGLTTVVVDHHQCSHIPDSCDIFINPNQPQCNFSNSILCASGIVWHLIVGVVKFLNLKKTVDIKYFLDLSALGTICDMVPLYGANRVLANRGLDALTYTSRKGLQFLKEQVGIRGRVKCSDISFLLGPRINAAGRMLTGDIIIKLLTTKDANTAKDIVDKICSLNKKRQSIEEKIKNNIINNIEKQRNLPSGIVAYGRDFHIGVIGIVAQRLVETYSRPSVVIGRENGEFKGSVRGIKGFDVYQALSSLKDYLVSFGGHKSAGGFSIKEDNIKEFKRAFEHYCNVHLSNKDYITFSLADTICPINQINYDLIKELQKLEPFGVGNPKPLLLARSLKILDVKVLKGKHLKVMLSDKKRFLTAFLWQRSYHPYIKKGTLVDITYTPIVNSFRGIDELQLHIDTAMPSAGN